MAQGTNLFTSHEARILATNAGSEEQPIYFTGGEPTATSYALKATVNNGDAKYVAYYSNERLIASSKSTYDMRMPAHYYHNLYEDNPTEGTTVYVHYYNTDTTSTNTFANLRVKSSSTFKTFVFGGDGNCSWEGHILANGGYLRSTANGNTVQIGSENGGFCHITNTAAIPFWFNQDITMSQGKHIGQAGSQYRPFQIYLGRYTTAGSNAINSNNPLIEFSNSDRSQYGQLVYSDYDSVRSPDGLTWVGNQANSWFQAPRVFGAVWNDYAEYRETKEKIQPGRCVVETGKGDLVLSTQRLQPGCEIVSDTFGFAIGETDKCKTPTACAGRVLAYLYEDNSLAHPGDPVCSGPNGTVSLMTHEEEIEWPSRIIATVSEIPDYEEWEYGSADEFGNKEKLKVDGRIWIRVR